MIIKVNVRPDSGKQQVVKDAGGYTIYLESPAAHNKANIELIKVLKKYFKKEIRIKSGLHSRKKIIEVKG